MNRPRDLLSWIGLSPSSADVRAGTPPAAITRAAGLPQRPAPLHPGSRHPLRLRAHLLALHMADASDKSTRLTPREAGEQLPFMAVGLVAVVFAVTGLAWLAFGG